MQHEGHGRSRRQSNKDDTFVSSERPNATKILKSDTLQRYNAVKRFVIEFRVPIKTLIPRMILALCHVAGSEGIIFRSLRCAESGRTRLRDGLYTLAPAFRPRARTFIFPSLVPMPCTSFKNAFGGLRKCSKGRESLHASPTDSDAALLITHLRTGVACLFGRISAGAVSARGVPKPKGIDVDLEGSGARKEQGARNSHALPTGAIPPSDTVASTNYAPRTMRHASLVPPHTHSTSGGALLPSARHCHGDPTLLARTIPLTAVDQRDSHKSDGGPPNGPLYSCEQFRFDSNTAVRCGRLDAMGVPTSVKGCA